jgi:hypothetical protein
MRAPDARAIAERVHARDQEWDGTPLLRHVERVARATRPEARAVAWLHETLELGTVSEQELLVAGLTDEQLRALRLLTHARPSRLDTAYLARVELIARAAGPGGRLARLVKRADLEDRSRHPLVRPDGWSPPYDRALVLLRRSAVRAATARPLEWNRAGDARAVPG